ncbi:MAG: YbhB/YbcL family Raf kinase inhibitor-like protein [archaeon]
MKISSTAFENNSFIPKKYSGKGENISPPLTIEDIPLEAKSLVVIVDDPDAPCGIWTHLVVFNIFPNAETLEIKENSIAGIVGQNDFRKNNYFGPCPPSGTHRYFFRVFALSKVLELKTSASRSQVENEMKNAIIDKAEFFGKFSRE